MTRPRRTGVGDRLTEEQLLELCSSLRLLIGLPSTFPSPEERRVAWKKHREAVRKFYARHFPQGHSGGYPKVPAAELAYERGEYSYPDA